MDIAAGIWFKPRGRRAPMIYFRHFPLCRFQNIKIYKDLYALQVLWSVGGSLSEITLYSGHTSAPKVASQFSPWKNPESNVSSNYLLFALSFCKHIEKFLWLGEEKIISEIRNNNQNNKLSPKSSKFDYIKLHKSKFSFCDVYFQSWWTLKMIPNLWKSPRCGGDAFGCASKFPVSHHHLQRNCPKFKEYWKFCNIAIFSPHRSQ